jgi:hypothetical protein
LERISIKSGTQPGGGETSAKHAFRDLSAEHPRRGGKPVRKSLFLVTVVGLLVGALVATMVPAGASITGTAEFSCTVRLPVWPTSNGPQVVCNGKATGFITGARTNGQRYNGLIVNDTLKATAATYSETCIGPEPVNGFARGTFAISGIQLSGSVTGTGTSTANFNWTRVGVNALITLSNGVVKKGATIIARGNSGIAAAAFIPTSTPGNCNAPRPLTALIIGQTLLIS